MTKAQNKVVGVEAAAERFSSKWWRLNNLYWIITDDGARVKFQCNDVQEQLFKNLWYLNIILKSRQHGITTFIALYLLDEIVFNSNVEGAVIAHTLPDAQKIFRRKIKYPYDNLPPEIKEIRRVTVDSKSELILSNGSALSVATSARSGTLQYLHVSEFGKVCATAPEKAREIVTGSLETLSPGQMAFIESTAEGRFGYFYDYAMEARKMQLAKQKLGELDFKLHFFPWYKRVVNTVDHEDVVISEETKDYLLNLEATEGVELTPGQKAWYSKKKDRLGEDMYREHPSTFDEAFQESMRGTYFAHEFKGLYAGGRITKVDIDPARVVHTAWDLGEANKTAIWFFQVDGRDIMLVDYYENCDVGGLPHYAEYLRDRKYLYGVHLGPHDLKVRDLGTGKSRYETSRDLGINFVIVPRPQRKEDAINAVRVVLPRCYFDSERCALGLLHLESYRRAWNNKLGVWRNEPLHDEHSDGADAFQVLAMGLGMTTPIQSRQVVKRIATGRL